MHELRRDLERYSDDPIVRRTIRRLRLSSIAVVVGMLACIALAGATANLAFDDGVQGGAEAATGVAQLEKRASAADAAAERLAASDPAAKKEGAAAREAVRAHRRQVAKARARAQRLNAAAVAAQAQASSAVDTGPDRPGPLVFGLLLVGLTSVGFLMFVFVRRPYEAAREHALELVQAFDTQQRNTLEAFAALNATVEAKDRYTAGHGLRVTLISLLIGQELELTDMQLDVLRHAATFHDIGKIAVPDHVLQKQGRLDDDEYDAMKVHAAEGARICSKLAALRACVPGVRGHHERMDGGGYPDGLRGEEIPLAARIIAVADAWDAITSDRPYRRGQPATVALDEIRRCTGPQFDPAVVRAFVEVLAKDPWMFGLTPADVQSDPAAPGRRPEHPSRAVEELTEQVRSLTSQDEDPQSIDWTSGFDEDDVAA